MCGGLKYSEKTFENNNLIAFFFLFLLKQRQTNYIVSLVRKLLPVQLAGKISAFHEMEGGLNVVHSLCCLVQLDKSKVRKINLIFII